MITTIDIKKARIPKRQFAFIRNVGPYMGDAALFARLFKQIGEWAGPKGLLGRPGMEAITVYHDDPKEVPVEKQRISVGFTVPQGTEAEGDVQMMDIPEGDYVVGSFKINPDQYKDCWTEVMKYMGQHQLLPTGLMYESYTNDPNQDPEGKHQVDICIAI